MRPLSKVFFSTQFINSYLQDLPLDKTVLIEQTSKRLKRWELIVTARLFLTLFAGFGLLYVAIPLGVIFFGLSGMCFLGFIAVRLTIWWYHG